MDWLLSSDSHVIEPPDLWTARVPAAYREIVPRVEQESEADWWVFAGHRTQVSYAGPSAAGLRFEGGARALNRELKFTAVMRGGYLPQLHVEENEVDGVWGSVLYPSIGLMLYGLEGSLALTAA